LTGGKPLDWSFTGTTDMTGTCFLYGSSDFVSSDLETPLKIHFQLNLETDYLEANYFYNSDHVGVLGDYIPDTEAINIHPDYAIFFDGDNEDDSLNVLGELQLQSVINNHPTEYDIILSVEYKQEKTILCSMTLQDLALFMEQGKKLNFTYVSETGLVFLEGHDNETGNLLSLQTYTDSGGFLVKSLFTTKFMLPGELDYPGFYNNPNDLKFSLQFKKRVLETNAENKAVWVSKPINHKTYSQTISIECFPRTNVI
jgi:hypothetical protein